MPTHRTRLCGLVVVPASAMAFASAVMAEPLHVGQVDAFGAENYEAWASGGVAAGLSLGLGGPAGASDYYLRVAGDGSSSGGKITTFNRAQWVGNYTTAGVTAVAMDLRNFGSGTLQIRLGLKEVAGFGSAGYCTTSPFSLPNDGQWHRAMFPITASAFTAINGPGSFADVVSGANLGEVRILHANSPTLTGSNVVGVLGIDNITAVPAPTAAPVLVLAAAAAFRRRRPCNSRT